jgi:hypothetical protein
MLNGEEAFMHDPDDARRQRVKPKIAMAGRAMRRMAFSLILAVSAMIALVGYPSTAMAQVATVHIQIYKAGFIVGVSGGDGALRYRGQTYPLSIGGVSLGATLGLSKVELVGTAHNLHDPADVEGVYSGLGAGLAVAGGRRIAKLTNSKGVVLEVKGRQVGFMFSIDLSGLQISLKK